MVINDISNKRVLFSPLNWGYGHVSRSISIIKELTQNNNYIIIACTEEHQLIYKSYFEFNSCITFIEHKGYPFKFNNKGHFIVDMLLSLPGLFFRYFSEKKQTQKYVDKYSIDYVISDHRYGFISSTVPSIFITHQLNLPLPKFGFFIQLIHYRLLYTFHQIWVLDDLNHRFSGKLSINKKSFNVDYIGLKSRFSYYSDIVEKRFTKVIVISGPEPYSRNFFYEQLDRFKNDTSVLIITPKLFTVKGIQIQCQIVLSNNWLQIDKLICESNMIISRSGYSTIMDVYYLNIPYELHPTPGQAEQIYLAELHGIKSI